MNNEKKIDLLLRAWLSDKDGIGGRAVETEKELIKEIKEALNPKEDVPYEKSLEEKEETYTCNECGFKTFTTEGMTIHLKNHKPKFAKSSINEKEKGQ